MRRFVFVIVLGCNGAPAIFPKDYKATYQEVRDCRMSLEHAATIRVLASPDAVDAYSGRTAAFPVGSFVLKEEYAQSDLSCSRPIVRYTVMRKLGAGTDTDSLDWEWQKVDSGFHEITTDLTTCVSCHSVCGKAPMGYDGTCAEP